MLGKSYLFASELDAWRSAVEGAEAQLVQTASHEYVMSLLNVCQGQYRNGFKALRLVLELCLQSVYLSSNLVNRAEWLSGTQDTTWARLVDANDGPLSKKFCNAFFPEIGEHVAHFRALAQTLYRELSECIHGNVPIHIPLPESLSFSRESLELWHSKAGTLRFVISFALALRYLNGMPSLKRAPLREALLDLLGHIEPIRLQCVEK